MKNKNNIMPAEFFPAPARCIDVETGRNCYVHDPRSWRNRNKRSNQNEESVPEQPKGKAPKGITPYA